MRNACCLKIFQIIFIFACMGIVECSSKVETRIAMPISISPQVAALAINLKNKIKSCEDQINVVKADYGTVTADADKAKKLYEDTIKSVHMCEKNHQMRKAWIALGGLSATGATSFHIAAHPGSALQHVGSAVGFFGTVLSIFMHSRLIHDIEKIPACHNVKLQQEELDHLKIYCEHLYGIHPETHTVVSAIKAAQRKTSFHR